MDDQNPAPEKFSPDYRIVIISILGIIGLLATLRFLAWEGKNGRRGEHTGSVFHEIGYHPRNAVAHAAGWVIDSLNGALERNRQQRLGYLSNRETVPDSIVRINVSVDTLNAHIKSDSVSIELLKVIKSSYEDSSLNDSTGLLTMSRVLHFRLTPDDLVHWDEGYDTLGTDWFARLPYRAKLAVNSKVFHYHDTLELTIRSYASNLQFIEKYPGAGIWIFLLMLFATFCFVATAVALFIRKQVVTLYKDHEKPDRFGYWLTAVGVFVTLAFLYWLLSFTFLDEWPVKNLFFMRTLTNVLLYVNVIGGIAGAFCLAGFIHSASMLAYFVKRNAQVSPTDRHCDFAQLLGFFHRYFILSAVLLSLVVVCTGAMYNTANSLDFVKLLVAKWGYSPAGGDAVYLYGGLYTAILLLIYLPAKMQFDAVRLGLPPEDRPGDDDDKKMGSWIEQPYSLLKGGLIAATPFLTGIFQSLLNLAFNH